LSHQESSSGWLELSSIGGDQSYCELYLRPSGTLPGDVETRPPRPYLARAVLVQRNVPHLRKRKPWSIGLERWQRRHLLQSRPVVTGQILVRARAVGLPRDLLHGQR